MKYVFGQDSTLETELVFGLIAPVGCNRKYIRKCFKESLKSAGYEFAPIRVSKILERLTPFTEISPPDEVEYHRVIHFMNTGNDLRKEAGTNILGLLAANEIRKKRHKNSKGEPAIRKVVYFIDSIKHVDEIEVLKAIYPSGFYAFSVNVDRERKKHYLQREGKIRDEKLRIELIDLDEDDRKGHGQQTSEAFNLADFFIADDGNDDKIRNTICRFIEILLGHPYRTPTFQEYAMFMAYSSSTRSADLSRQVGAVVTRGTDILATGANDCPKPGGGHYWPKYNPETAEIYDSPGGRDWKRNEDFNAKETKRITDALVLGIENPDLKKMILENIDNSRIKEITEYGRVIHAEMDAILSCSRNSIPSQGATLICTTFPCHNCAKHIISAGIKLVIYIEPYPKSKALEMHDDAIVSDERLWDPGKNVLFRPFIGVGPRQFINLFSMKLGVGAPLRRKLQDKITACDWENMPRISRIKMLPSSYLDNEVLASANGVDALHIALHGRDEEIGPELRKDLDDIGSISFPAWQKQFFKKAAPNNHFPGLDNVD